MKKYKVLIVEDEEVLQDLWKEMLTRGGCPIEIFSAFTLEEAREIFAENDEWDAIVVAGCIVGFMFNTAGLVEFFRESFSGPIIAASSRFNPELIEAGCNFRVDKKSNVSEKLKEVLKI